MNKRNFFFTFLSLLTFLILFSCSTDSDNVVYTEDGFEYKESDDTPLKCNAIDSFDRLSYSDGYLYFINGYCDYINFPPDITLVRYNTATGNTSSVCSDPLCQHNTPECAFYGLTGSFNIWNNYIIYPIMYIKDLSEPDENGNMVNSGGFYNSYDMNTFKVKHRNEINPFDYTEYTMQLFSGDYCFYYDYVYNEKNDEYAFAVCRWDLSTNTITQIGGNDNILADGGISSFASRFIFVLDSRLYFTDGKQIFSTDFNYDNVDICCNGQFLGNVFTDENYIYYSVLEYSTDCGKQVYKIYRMNFDGSDICDMGIECEDSNWTITSDYIYYKPFDSILIGTKRSGSNNEDLYLYNSVINRCNHNGDNHETVFIFTDEYHYTRSFYECYIGNYIYCLFDTWNDTDNNQQFVDEDYNFSGNSPDYRIMRIDISTGEIYIINGDLS